MSRNETDRQPTADDVILLINRLSAEEFERLLDHPHFRKILPEMIPAFDVFEVVAHLARLGAQAKRQLVSRTPKPRKTDRDAAIVRLRDEENLTFGKIRRALLDINPRWCNGEGRPLSIDAVKQAYRRHKSRPPGRGQSLSSLPIRDKV